MKIQTDDDYREIIKAAIDLAKIAEAEAITEALGQYTGYLSGLGLVRMNDALQPELVEVYDWQEILAEYTGILAKEPK